MNYNKLLDTAILAGQILLESNAETYRVEDVMNRILDVSCLESTEALALGTGLIATLSDPKIGSITVTKRITKRETNLGKIAWVNAVCRELTSGVISIDKAYEKLLDVYETHYSTWVKNLAISLIPAFFALLLGGGLKEFIFAWLCGGILTLIMKLEKETDFGFFAHNIIYTCIMVIFIYTIQNYLISSLNSHIIITASLFPLLPGTAITNAFRDSLRGDYMSAIAKSLEAILIAGSIAIGAALGLIFTGGIAI